MNFIHVLDDPWAEHPVVNKHICNGGGGSPGGGFMPSNQPSLPDYSQYIAQMTNIGGTLTGYGKDLYDWAKNAGVQVSNVANQVSQQAGALAGQAGQNYTDMMAKWKQTYQPLYDAQAADAQRMIGNLPQTEEQYAGKYAADTAQAFDASKAASDRQLRSYGLKAPGSGAQALDAVVSNQRALGQVAAGEQGRLAARTEARGVTGQALQAGQIFPTVANQSASTELSAGNQQVGAPESAISTTVGAYSPTIAAYNSAFPYMGQWGSTMANSYNQNLAGYNAYNSAMGSAAQRQASQPGSGIGSLLGGVAGTIGGSFLGPIGSSVGGSLGKSLGGALGGSAEGGSGHDLQAIATGGSNGENYVDPSTSPSRGAITDDVPARLNAGEFVWPQDVVAWRGEEWMQKQIQKARDEREKHTVAEPDVTQARAIDMQAPTFRSEGAQA